MQEGEAVRRLLCRVFGHDLRRFTTQRIPKGSIYLPQKKMWCVFEPAAYFVETRCVRCGASPQGVRP